MGQYGFPNIYSSFQGIIEAYVRNPDGSVGVARTYTNPRTGAALPLSTQTPTPQAQFGTMRLAAPPWFMLCADRGVGSGELKLIVGPDDRLTCGEQAPMLQEGDFIFFKPEEGVEWARLYVKRAAIGQYEHTYTLEGESRRIIGTPAYDTQGETKTFASPEYVVHQAVSWMLDGSGPLESSYYLWDNYRDIETRYVEIAEYKIDAETLCEHMLDDLAHLHQTATAETLKFPVFWGVDNGMGRANNYYYFYFRGRPDLQAMRFTRRMVGGKWQQRLYFTAGMDDWTSLIGSPPPVETETNLLNWPERSTGPYYNVLTIKGGVQQLSGLVFRKQYSDSASIAASGCRSYATREVPTIRGEIDADLYASAFFKRYARPPVVLAELQAIIPSADALPLPWAGYCLLDTAEHDALEEWQRRATIRNVKVTFDVQPMAEIMLGEIEHTNPLIGKDGNPWRVGVPLHDAMMRRREAPSGSIGGEGSGSSASLSIHTHDPAGDPTVTGGPTAISASGLLNG